MDRDPSRPESPQEGTVLSVIENILNNHPDTKKLRLRKSHVHPTGIKSTSERPDPNLARAHELVPSLEQPIGPYKGFVFSLFYPRKRKNDVVGHVTFDEERPGQYHTYDFYIQPDGKISCSLFDHNSPDDDQEHTWDQDGLEPHQIDWLFVLLKQWQHANMSTATILQFPNQEPTNPDPAA